MNNWVQHEKKWGSYYRAIPPMRQGHGHTTEDKPTENANFERDDKTGLLLPAGAAKERRKVKIGFQP